MWTIQKHENKFTFLNRLGFWDEFDYHNQEANRINLIQCTRGRERLRDTNINLCFYVVFERNLTAKKFIYFSSISSFNKKCFLKITYKSIDPLAIVVNVKKGLLFICSSSPEEITKTNILRYDVWNELNLLLRW